MAYKIAGGSKWWQVRAGPGVEGEWIIMKKDWKDYKAREKNYESRSRDEQANVGLAGDDEGLKRNGQCELLCIAWGLADETDDCSSERDGRAAVHAL